MPLAPEAWTRISAVTTPVFSKDGGTVFHLRGTGLPQVWAMARTGGEGVQLSFHEEKVSFLRRAPDSDRLLWGIDAGGDEHTQFWTLEPGAAPRPITRLPAAMHDFGAFSGDGARIAFAANDRDERVFDLCVMDTAGGPRRRVREGEGILSVLAWRKGSETLAALEDFASLDQFLWLVDAVTGDARRVPLAGPCRIAAVRFTEDGALMGLTDAGGAEFMRLCRIDPVSGAVAELHAPAGRDVEAWSLSPDGNLLATIENDRGWSVLRVGAPGGERAVIEGLPEGVVAELAWAPDSRALAFAHQGPAAPSGLWLWEGAALRSLLRPDALAEAGVEAANFVVPRLVAWTSFDGMEIPGWFATPRGAAPAGGFPAVVWVHGGPVGQTRPNFRADMQMLLDQGYAVLMPNIRGSSGYGRTYTEADDVGLRGDALADLAAGRAWLAAQPGIDAARIGIMGQSYGGWVVLAAITRQPDLWKSAVDYYGIADFVSLLGRTGAWRRDHRAREYGFPEAEAGLFARISPIHHVSRVRAPLLVLHGDRDPRVPMHESDRFVEAMEHHQKPVRYERFTYAGHGFIRPEHRRRVYDAVAAHFRATLCQGAP